jgi:putative oxidoreductase
VWPLRTERPHHKLPSPMVAAVREGGGLDARSEFSTPLPNPPPPQVGLARLAHHSAEPEQARVPWGREQAEVAAQFVVMAAAALAGRLLLAALFLHEAWSKLTGYDAALSYMQAFGVPGQLLPLAIAAELACGLLISLGYQTRAAAIILAAFCTATAVLFHTRFADRNQLLHFEKDLALAGAFLVLFARGGGAWAIDAIRSHKKQ